GADGIGFTSDVQPPLLVIAQPAPDSWLRTQVDFVVKYSDDVALDLATFQAKLDGVPVGLSKGPEGATGRFPVPDGAHVFEASVQDRAGNPTSASASFHVDITRPSVAVVQPPPASKLKNPTPLVQVTYGDTEQIDLSSLRIKLDGA